MTLPICYDCVTRDHGACSGPLCPCAERRHTMVTSGGRAPAPDPSPAEQATIDRFGMFDRVDRQQALARLAAGLAEQVPAALAEQQRREGHRRHNHVTRDIKPRGQCPACNRQWETVQ